MYVWGSSKSRVSAVVPEVDINCPEVLIINTRSYNAGLLDKDGPSQTNFAEILEENSDLYKEGVPPFKVAELNEVKVSSDQTYEDWVQLANMIKENYHKYRGFVVQNGTDNMVSTATALSFMLENLGKPVVFTGSVIPADLLYTDLKRNMIVALLFANCTHLTEVCILFDERLFRANRTIKVSRSTLLPFDSPHFPPLATMHGKMCLHTPFIRPFPNGRFRVMENMKERVLTLKLGPATPKEALLRAIELTEARALVLIAYGDGNGPMRGDYMKNVVSRAVERGIVVVVCTQNLYGSVHLSTYAAGKQLLEAGAISAHDMTIQAAVMKLKYLLGLGISQQKIKYVFSENIRGEISPLPAKL